MICNVKKIIVSVMVLNLVSLYACIGDGPCPDLYRSQKVIAALPVQEQKMQIASEALSKSDAIPTKYTCQGENISPDIEWSNVTRSSTVRSFVLLVTSDQWVGVNRGINPKAADGNLWIVYNIPIMINKFSEGTVISNSMGIELKKYNGPCLFPFVGRTSPINYSFTVYALDIVLDPAVIITKDDLIVAMQDHIVSSGTMIKTYKPTQE